MKYEHPTKKLPKGRAQLVHVLSTAGDVIHVADVTRVLGTSRAEAAKRLSRWTEQGWLRRVGRGTYVPVAIDTMGEARVLDDAWVFVPPCSRRAMSADAPRPHIGT